jgi:hypothetical protein
MFTIYFPDCVYAFLWHMHLKGEENHEKNQCSNILKKSGPNSSKYQANFLPYLNPIHMYIKGLSYVRVTFLKMAIWKEETWSGTFSKIIN